MTFGVGAHLMAMIGTYLICQDASTKCTVRRGGHSTALWEMSKRFSHNCEFVDALCMFRWVPLCAECRWVLCVCHASACVAV